MGLGFKDFTAGDVLTADQVDGYLMRQTIMTFASTSARDTALSGVLDEGMFAFTEDTDSVWYYTGSAWIAFQSSWTSFTPSYNNVTLGNATNTGMYRYQLGDLRMITRLLWGSTTAFTGTVTIDLANGETAQSDVTVPALGQVRMYDSSGDQRAWGFAEVNAGATVADLYDVTPVERPVSATDPFTWASGDILNLDVVVPL